MMKLKKWASLLVVAVLFCATAVDAQSTKSKRKAKAKSATQSKPAAAPQTVTPDNEPTAVLPKPDDQKPATPPGEIERITVEELKAKIAKNEPVTIIDSRSQGSYDGSNQKIKGAIRIPAGDIESRLKEIPRDKEVVIYCT